MGHEDYLKIWKYQTGELFRTIPIANKGCHSKFVLTESLLICSIYGGLEFHDLRICSKFARKIFWKRIGRIFHESDCIFQSQFRTIKRLMGLIESDRTLIRRMDDFEHDMVDFIFQNDRIVVAERKMLYPATPSLAIFAIVTPRTPLL